MNEFCTDDLVKVLLNVTDPEPCTRVALILCVMVAGRSSKKPGSKIITDFRFQLLDCEHIKVLTESLIATATKTTPPNEISIN